MSKIQLLKIGLSLAWFLASDGVYGQSVPVDQPELQSRFTAAMATLRPIVARKVLPAYGDPESTSVEALTLSEMQSLLFVIGQADFIHSQLSPGETNYEERQRATNATCELTCRRVCRWVCYRSFCGRSYGRWEWVVERAPIPKQRYEMSGERRPLRDNIQSLGSYFSERVKRPNDPAASQDRAAALQVMSVLLNLDPNFRAGDVAG
jgi:hypothetical protein